MPRTPTKTEQGHTATRRDASAIRGEISDALLAVIRDPDAPAMAKASAGRTLLDLLREDDALRGAERSDKPMSEMSVEDIDAEIARLQRGAA
jgi:hypothetical protein